MMTKIGRFAAEKFRRNRGVDEPRGQIQGASGEIQPSLARLEMSVVETPELGWHRFGPLGSSASHLQRALARHLWLAINPTREPGDLPAGWPNGQFMGTTTIDCADSADGVCIVIDTFFWSKPDEFLSWPDRNSQRENPHLSAS